LGSQAIVKKVTIGGRQADVSTFRVAARGRVQPVAAPESGVPESI